VNHGYPDPLLVVGSIPGLFNDPSVAVDPDACEFTSNDQVPYFRVHSLAVWSYLGLSLR
jgi:hypothetical protein